MSGRKTVDDGDWRDGDDIPFPERGFPIELFARNASTKGNFRPDPLTLVVKLVNGKPTMNNEPYNDLDQLTRKLREIFKDREANGVFREGTNEVEKTVNVQVDAAGTGSGTGQRYGDIVSLIDAVKGGGSNSIIIIDAAAFRMEPVSPLVLRNGLEEPPPPPLPLPRTGAIPKTISGGVINGKAISLPKPLYPAAAKAVKASGAVTVQVLVDTSGNVISATAVSGHPLLRSAAVQAARSAKFAPTMLSGQPVSVNGVLTYNFVPE